MRAWLIVLQLFVRLAAVVTTAFAVPTILATDNVVYGIPMVCAWVGAVSTVFAARRYRNIPRGTTK